MEQSTTFLLQGHFLSHSWFNLREAKIINNLIRFLYEVTSSIAEITAEGINEINCKEKFL